MKTLLFRVFSFVYLFKFKKRRRRKMCNYLKAVWSHSVYVQRNSSDGTYVSYCFKFERIYIEMISRGRNGSREVKRKNGQSSVENCSLFLFPRRCIDSYVTFIFRKSPRYLESPCRLVYACIRVYTQSISSFQSISGE